MCKKGNNDGEKIKETNDETVFEFGAKKSASPDHENGEEHKNLESTARKMKAWRDWWQRKRRSSHDQLPPIRPARELVGAFCRLCGARCIVFRDDVPLCLKCMQKLIRTPIVKPPKP